MDVVFGTSSKGNKLSFIVLVTCMNSWYYNSKYSKPYANIREQCFFLSDVILSQRDIWELSEQYILLSFVSSF